MAIDHPVNDVLAEPYRRLDAWQGWQYPLRALVTQGNGYLIVKRMRGNGFPVELTPAVEGGPSYGSDGRFEYTLSTIHEGQVDSGNLRAYKAQDVVALHWYGFDGLNSPSPIKHAAASTLRSMQAVDRHLQPDAQPGRECLSSVAGFLPKVPGPEPGYDAAV